MHWTLTAAILARVSAGIRIEISTAMMPMTTRSSTNVNAAESFLFIDVPSPNCSNFGELPCRRVGRSPTRDALIRTARIDVPIAKELILPTALWIARAIAMHPEPPATNRLLLARLIDADRHLGCALVGDLAQVVPTGLARNSSRMEDPSLARGWIRFVHVRELSAGNHVLIGSRIRRGIRSRYPPVIKLSILNGGPVREKIRRVLWKCTAAGGPDARCQLRRAIHHLDRRGRHARIEWIRWNFESEAASEQKSHGAVLFEGGRRSSTPLRESLDRAVGHVVRGQETMAQLTVLHRRGADLPEVGCALDAFGLVSGAFERGQEDPNQHGDDPDDHEQFDQCK